MPYLVVVSHSSVDTWVARQLAARIEAASGADVFLDVVDIEKGDDYDEKIWHAINRCRELVVLMTPTARDSKNVWMEVGAMWGRGERTVGILYGIGIDDVRSDPRMPQGFKKLELVDINDADAYICLHRRTGSEGPKGGRAVTRKSAVFISHTREDGRWADAIADALEDAGMSVWRESWTLRTGETWQRELRRALDRSSTVLVLVSSKAADSKWMQFEAGAALGASFGSKKRVVPVYLSHRGRDYLPLLRGLESIDLAGLHPEQGAKRVADYLASAA